ncbi:hypothetical protein SKAU_G00323610 [Synaphobranchus kaupii]|uniref:Uncharacterized protein n=1 Tax=Synaphobranchus kaupii TaxID=118154 RepID=A0A9Q1IHW8_SYNKA|nr:hypothetical protein SKAU_G00323610 [Synaphobranchus kaupii]
MASRAKADARDDWSCGQPGELEKKRILVLENPNGSLHYIRDVRPLPGFWKQTDTGVCGGETPAAALLRGGRSKRHERCGGWSSGPEQRLALGQNKPD